MLVSDLRLNFTNNIMHYELLVFGNILERVLKHFNNLLTTPDDNKKQLI